MMTLPNMTHIPNSKTFVVERDRREVEGSLSVISLVLHECLQADDLAFDLRKRLLLGYIMLNLFPDKI
jgi:hypothetical protein